jgi:hypothetical protein
MPKQFRLLKIMLALALLGIPGISAQAETDGGWSNVGTGIDYQVFDLYPNPVPPYHIYVTRMDRSNPNVFIESSLSAGALKGTGKQTVRQMASLNDEAINYWSKAWGGRNHVVAAINGDFQPSDSDNTPYKGVIHSGWFDKRVPENNGWSGFVWTMNRAAFIGECVTYPEGSQYITYADKIDGFPINGINVPPQEGQLIVYTPDFGNYTPTTGKASTEVTLEMNQPAGVIPRPNAAYGKVIDIHKGNGGTSIPFDTVVISGVDNAATSLTNHVQPNDVIGITQEIDSGLWNDCGKPPVPYKDWSNAYASVGGAYAFLQNGTVDGHKTDVTATDPIPRTAILMNDQYIFFMVVEGVEKPVSQGGEKGMNFQNMGDFGKDILKATWGIAEDGGGSSTMVVNGSVVNHPSCPDADVGTPACERSVVNGMMMVVQEPMEQSTLYNAGDQTPTRNPTAVRLGPGTNYGQIAYLPAQSQVTIQHDMHNLDGVYAKYQAWWKVESGGVTGWISQLALNGKLVMLPFIRR